MNKKPAIFVTALIIVLVGYLFRERILRVFYAPTSSLVETGVITKQIEETDQKEVDKEMPNRLDIDTVVENLDIPWELVFLPDGRMLVTERPGRVLLISDQKKNYEVKEVAHIGEGGLLGMALDPDFTKNNFLYLYFTYREGGQILNKVQRFVFKNESLVEDKVIID